MRRVRRQMVRVAILRRGDINELGGGPRAIRRHYRPAKAGRKKWPAAGGHGQVAEGEQKMQMNLPEHLKPIADTVVETYRAGRPVIVLDENERCMHGVETLEVIIQTGAPLEAVVISGIDRQEFETSDLPEICEAARLVWLEDGFPTK